MTKNYFSAFLKIVRWYFAGEMVALVQSATESRSDNVHQEFLKSVTICPSYASE